MSISIPAFHVSDTSLVKGAGHVSIPDRAGPGIAGTFDVRIDAHFVNSPSPDPYPVGALTIVVNLNDGFQGTFTASSIELMNSHGKVNPTVFLTGQCKVQDGTGAKVPTGLRYWLMIVGNGDAASAGKTPSFVSFAIHDRTGALVAYGTGPAPSGAFHVVA